AFKDNLRQGLTLVEDRMRQRLETIAAQTIGPIGTMSLSSGEAQKIEKYFADVKQSHPEVDTIFAFEYQNGPKSYLYADKFEEESPPAGWSRRKMELLFIFDKALEAKSFLDDHSNYLFLQDSWPGNDKRQGTYLFYPMSEQGHFAGVLLKE